MVVEIYDDREEGAPSRRKLWNQVSELGSKTYDILYKQLLKYTEGCEDVYY